ncbi:hypothetical protein AYI68_g1580 [Smittium mucronatum]|uniref:Uncharacterized protein n=1 Tax=Smittium mucronatum TaxID=133383 RepID=A0A1R0H520_9FUNG|nr:hypothetical protein AYI68_g1580 [Smittium mucronatum]
MEQEDLFNSLLYGFDSSSQGVASSFKNIHSDSENQPNSKNYGESVKIETLSRKLQGKLYYSKSSKKTTSSTNRKNKDQIGELNSAKDYSQNPRDDTEYDINKSIPRFHKRYEVLDNTKLSSEDSSSSFSEFDSSEDTRPLSEILNEIMKSQKERNKARNTADSSYSNSKIFSKTNDAKILFSASYDMNYLLYNLESDYIEAKLSTGGFTIPLPTSGLRSRV